MKRRRNLNKLMSILLVGCMLATMLPTLGVLAAETETQVFAQDFEALSAGEDGTDDSRGAQVLEFDGGHVLQILDEETATGSSTSYANFQFPETSGVITVSYRMYVDSEPAEALLCLSSGSKAKTGGISTAKARQMFTLKTMGADKKLRLQGRGSGSPSTSSHADAYAVGDWTQVKVVMDLPGKTFEVFANDVSCGTAELCYTDAGIAVDGVDNISFFTETAGVAKAYIDDVTVTVRSGETPGPGPVDPEPPEEGTVAYTQDFEGSVNFQGTPSGSKVSTVEGNKVLEITDTSTSSTSKANLAFAPQSGEITVDFRVHVLSEDSLFYMTCGSHETSGSWATASNGQVFRLTFGGAGDHILQFRGAHTSTNSGDTANSYKVGDWTQVRVVMNTQTGKFSVYSDGTLLGETDMGYPAAVGVTDLSQIDNVAFSTNTAGVAHAYVDDIKVTVKASGEGPGPVDPDDPKPGATEYWTPPQASGTSFTTTTDQVIATLPVSGVTMAVGEGTWDVTNNSKPITLNGQTYTKHINTQSGGAPKVNEGKGEYFKFAIPQSVPAGELVVALRVNAGRVLRVLEDGQPMTGYEDPQPVAVSTETAAKLAVVGGRTYTVYVESSIPYFYGFSFRPVDLEADIAAFQAELDRLDFDWIRGENASADAVDKDLSLPTSYTSAFGACDVNWTSDSAAVANNGAVNRLAADTQVTLTANISVQQISYLNLDKDFTVTVKALTDDAQAVAGAKAALDLGGLSAVKKDLVLPAEGKHGTTITWVSSDPDIVTVDEENHLGVIHPNDAAAQTVTLTATITRGGVTDTKEFEVTVAAAKILDVDSWAYATAAGDTHFAPTDGGKLRSINVTNNNQHLDTNDYKFKVEILDAQGNVKTVATEQTASAFFTHGAGVSEHLELDLAMDSGDSFRVTAYDDARTYVTFTHCAADETVAPGAKVYVIGDSTAAVYDNNKYPQTGWAQVLGEFFDGVEIVDLAIPGRSSLDFKTRQQFEDLKRDIRPGDYLIIQFGHNDSHNADASIYTDPTLDRFADGEAPSYKRCMAEYVTLAWDAGAHPIIATSISRRKLDDATGQLYANAAKDLAAELSIPCVDVLDATNGWINKVGLLEAIDMFNIIKPQDSRFYNDPAYKDSTFWNGNNASEASWDNTHVNRNGARLIAMYAADGIVALGVPLGAKRNAATVSETLPHYADAISGPPPQGDKTPAQTGCIDFLKDGWKLQLPVEDPARPGSVLEKSPQELADGYTSEYFYADADDAGDDAVVFHTPVEGAKTGNTSYTRSELREMLDPTNKAVNWTWEGTHTLTVEQRVTHVSAKGQVITSQIHGIEKNGDNANPLVKVRYVYDAATRAGKVVVEIKKTTIPGAEDFKYEFPNVALGQKYKTVINVTDGVASVTVSTVENGQERAQTFTKDFVAADLNWKNTLYYFKVGSYIQDNADTGADAYADVWTYSARTDHGPGGDVEPTLPPLTDSVTVTAGSASVAHKFAVSGTGNKVLTFTVTPSATQSKLNGGIKFYMDNAAGEKVEVLRFKLDNGKFKMSEVKNGAVGTYAILSEYSARTSYPIKMVLRPAQSGKSARVQVYLVDGQSETQLGSDYTLSAADLSELTQLSFFTDSSCSGTLTYTGIQYETGVEMDPGLEPVEGAAFAQDFEGDVSYLGSHTGAEVIMVDGNRVLAVTDTATGSSSTASRANFSFAPQNGEITITFKLKVLTEDSMVAMTCGSTVKTGTNCVAKAGEYLRLKTMGTSGKFQYRGGNGTGVTANNYTYTLGQWIDVKVVADTGKGTFSAYADGTLLGSTEMSNTSTSVLTDIDNIAFLTEKAGVAQVYVDNVLITVKESPAPGPGEETVAYTQNFEGSVSFQGTPTGSKVSTVNGNKVLEVTDTSTSATSKANLAFAPQSGEIAVDFRVNVLSAESIFYMTCGSHERSGTWATASNGQVLRLTFGSEERKLQFRGAHTSDNSGDTANSYKVGDWTQVRVVMNTQTGKFSVYSDGTLLGETTMGYPAAVGVTDLSGIDNIAFSTNTAGVAHAYVDDIKVTVKAPGEGPVDPPDPPDPPEPPTELPERLTVTAGESAVSNKFVVAGGGNQTLVFTVTPSATTGLNGGVKFFTDGAGGEKVEVLRLKLDAGTLKLGEVRNGTAAYANLSSYPAGEAMTLKVVIVPRSGEQTAFAKVYKVDGQGQTLLGSPYAVSVSDLGAITQLDFFADANRAGSFAYTAIAFQANATLSEEESAPPAGGVVDPDTLPTDLTYASDDPVRQFPVTTGAGNVALSFTVTPSATAGLKGGVKFYSGNTELVRFKLDAGTFKLGEMLDGTAAYTAFGAYEAGKTYDFRLVYVPAGEDGERRMYVCRDGEQIGSILLTQTDPAAIDNLRFFTDSGSAGSFEYHNMSYASGVDFQPQDTPALTQYLLKNPGAWTLGEGAAIENERLIVRAGEASSSNRVDVSGEGVKTLSFTVAVDVDNVKNLKGGVNFRDAAGNTVLRFKLQNGGMRLSDMSVDADGKTIYQSIGGSFAAKSTFQVKIELFPAVGTRDAYVRVHKDGKVICDAFRLTGENAATLERVTRLYVYTDSNSYGTYTYSDMIYQTGPKTPAQAGCIDFVKDGWTLLEPAAGLEKSPAELAEGYVDGNFYAAADDAGNDAVALRYPSAQLRETKSWKCDGSHTLTLEQSVPQVGADGQAVTAQVLTADDTPLVQLRYVYDAAAGTGKVVAEVRKTAQGDPEGTQYTFPDVALGQRFRTAIRVSNGLATLTVSTTDPGGADRAESYSNQFVASDPVWRDSLYTFAVGGCAPEGSEADVWTYSAAVEHRAVVPIGGSGGSRPSTSESDYSDGGSTVTETWSDGTVVTTQTAANGDVMRTRQNPDGTVNITVTAQNGDGTVTVDADGKTQARVSVSEAAAEKARQAGEVLTLPLPQLKAGKDMDSAPTVEIAKGAGSGVLVKLPVKQAGAGVVPVAMRADGAWEIIKMSVPTENGVIFKLSGDRTVKLVDNAKRFADVPSAHWAAGAVDFASARELLVGTGENRFSPDGVTTRATVVTILARLDGTDTSGGETWYSKGMDWAVANGVSDGTAPEALISREQFVTMLYRYGGQPTSSGNALSAFADGAAVSSWARPAMEWAVSNGLMKGRPDGTLDPAGTATRAEAATLFMRYCMWALGVPLDAQAPSAGGAETVALEMDFDAEALGRSWARGTKVVDLDGERVVEITDENTAKSTVLNYLFDAQSGKVAISFKMYIDPQNADTVFAMTCGSRALTGNFSSNSRGEFLRLKTTGASRKIQFRGGDSTKTPSVTGTTYQPGEWVDLKVVVDTDTQTFDAYANGVLMGEDQPLSSKGGVKAKSIDNITFMTEKAGLGRAYIDDVKVTGQVRQFAIWDAGVAGGINAAAAAAGDLLGGTAKWQLKQGKIADGALYVMGGEDSASNRVEVSGTGNKELCFTVTTDDAVGAKGGVRFLSEGKEVLRFKLDGGKLKLSDMRTDASGKVVYENLGGYSADTDYAVRVLILDKTPGQAACVKVYVNGKQAGSAYVLGDATAAALEKLSQLNFFTDKNTSGTLTYRALTYRAGVDAPADVPTPAAPPSGDTPAGTGCIDFLKDGWKIQLPVENPGKAGSVLEKGPQELADGYTDEFFYAAVDEDGVPAVVFHSPVKGFKTGNTSYARSELRELLDHNDNKVNWTWQGTHTLETEERVTHVPASGQVITAQIHGIEQNGDNANPLVKVRYVYEAAKGMGKVVVELKNTTSPTSYDFKYTFPNVALGQKYKTQIQVFDGAACVTISTTDPDGAQRSETYRHDFVAADPYWKETWYYFKLGNYIQDNKDESDGAYADVWVYSSSITHSDSVEKIPVSAITMDQSAVSIRSGERTGLSVSAAPIKAYDKSVTWAVTAGSDVAVVDKDGFVTGLREGTATVTATSVSNPSATASCTVTVKDEAVVAVKSVFDVDFGGDAGKPDPAGYGGAGCAIAADAPANTAVAVVNEGGNNLVTLRDDAADAPAKLSFVFAPQTDTTTIAFKVRIDALGEHQVGKADFGRMYLVAAGSDDWYTNDTELFRIRNSAKGTLGNFSALTYVLTDHYDQITMNADKVVGSYGDWVDVVYVVTPNNGTAKANTTDVYMNGYPVALAVANRNTVDYVNRLDVQTGTEDTLTFSLDDVKVYTGIVLPENTALVKPAALELVRVPAVMAVMDSAQAAVEVAPAEGYEKVRYSVVSGDAVCVSDDGYVTAVRPGVAEVRAESVLDSAVFAQRTVTVQETVVRPQSLRVPGAVHVAPGGSEGLQVAVLPENATEKGVKYEIVSGGEVASVDSRGVVTGKTVGAASVRVTSLSDPAVFATVPVSVTRTLTPGEVIFAEDFSAGELDSTSWSASLAKDNTFVKLEDGAMTLIDANPAANPKVTLDFTPASGKVSIQFRIKVDGEVTIQGGSVRSTGYRNLRIAFGAGNIATTANESFCLRGNGTHFTYNTTGSTYVEIPGDYNVAEWNEVTLVTTVNADGPDVTDVYINGVKALAGAANKVDYPAIDKLCFSADTANVAAFTVDDLAIWAGDYGDKPSDMTMVRFSDVPAGHWAQEAIGFACKGGLMGGVGGGAFAPDVTTTRATVVTILARLAGADTAGGETWYSKATDWAVANGVSDGTDPDGPISREQFVTMLYRFAGQPRAAGTLSGFADGAAVSPWARPAMEWAVANGLMQGRADGVLDPAGTTTRAEAAALLMRYCRWRENAQ